MRSSNAVSRNLPFEWAYTSFNKSAKRGMQPNEPLLSNSQEAKFHSLHHEDGYNSSAHPTLRSQDTNDISDGDDVAVGEPSTCDDTKTSYLVKGTTVVSNLFFSPPHSIVTPACFRVRASKC